MLWIFRMEDVTLEVCHDGADFEVYALWKGRQVGYAWCVRKGHRLELCDLKVEESRHWRVPLVGGQFGWFGIHGWRVRMRGRGIGRRLVECVLETARADGVEEVFGCVVPKDIAAKPNLLAWYVKRGFAVTDPDADCLSSAVKKITWRPQVPNNA